jgi:hypothetical protein
MTFKKMILAVAVLLMVATVTMSAAAQEAVSKNKGTTTDPNAKPGDSSNVPVIRGSALGALNKIGGGTVTSEPQEAKTGGGKDASAIPFLISLSQAITTVEKAFPDSIVVSGEMQYITIKQKSGQVSGIPITGQNKREMVSNNNGTVTPAYLISIIVHDRAGNEAREYIPLPTRDKDKPFKTEGNIKFVAQGAKLVVVNGTSGEIIPLDEDMFTRLGLTPDNTEAGTESFRGIEKKDIRRGMVIAKPGSITPHAFYKETAPDNEISELRKALEEKEKLLQDKQSIILEQIKVITNLAKKKG